MRMIGIGTAMALVLTGALAARADDAGARKPLELYLKGHATGNGDFWRQAFHPGARIEGMRDGKLVSRTVEEFAGGASGKPADDEAQRTRRIVSVDVTDDAAFAKIELDYPRVKFTDYFTLLKIDGEWKIMSKVYHGQPKP
ncbi:MAG: nuclear transport factor 2 family protein [Vicinamibacteria bacterium]